MNEPVQDHEFQWFEVRDLTNLSALNPGQPPKQPDPQEQVKPSLHTQEQVKPSFFGACFRCLWKQTQGRGLTSHGKDQH